MFCVSALWQMPTRAQTRPMMRVWVTIELPCCSQPITTRVGSWNNGMRCMSLYSYNSIVFTFAFQPSKICVLKFAFCVCVGPVDTAIWEWLVTTVSNSKKCISLVPGGWNAFIICKQCKMSLKLNTNYIWRSEVNQPDCPKQAEVVLTNEKQTSANWIFL